VTNTSAIKAGCQWQVIVLVWHGDVSLNIGQAKPLGSFAQYHWLKIIAQFHWFILRYARWRVAFINADHFLKQFIPRLPR
jgi:hypothetical protein